MVAQADILRHGSAVQFVGFCEVPARIWKHSDAQAQPDGPQSGCPKPGRWRAVWVWCGDREGCKDHYKECWLKHLVSLSLLTDSECASLSV